MATHRHYFEQQHFIGERRAKPRVAPELLTYVSFGGDNGGMVLDVSEGGLAVATAFAIPEAALVDITIPTDATHERIEVTARVAWIGESKRRVGVEFAEPSQDTREALRKWIRQERASEAEDIASASAIVEVSSAGPTNLASDAPAVESGLAVETVPVHETVSDVPEEISAPQAVVVEPLAPAEVVATPEQSAAAASNEFAEAEKPQIAVPEATAERLETLDPVPLVPSQGFPAVVVLGGVGGASATHGSFAEPAQSARTVALRTVAEKPAGESPRVRERPLSRSRETEAFPSKSSTGRAKDAGELLAAPFVEKGKTFETERMQKFPLVAAFVLMVLGGFALGIVIGRSVLGRWTQTTSAAKQRLLPSGNVPRAATLPHPSPTFESGAKPEARASVNTETNASPSTQTSPVRSDKGRQADAASAPTNARADSTAGTSAPGNRRGATVASGAITNDAHSDGAQAAKALPDKSVKNSASMENRSVATAGREVLVTPDEGDTPLRVELGEEVIAQSPSLDIRASRFAMVAGARSRKGRKERLTVGPIISRVTPQPPASALASVPQNGELIVVVRVTIAGDGHVVYVDPLSGPIALIPSVMTAIREWKYQPSLLDGEPAETQADLTLTFRTPR